MVPTELRHLATQETNIPVMFTDRLLTDGFVVDYYSTEDDNVYRTKIVEIFWSDGKAN